MQQSNKQFFLWASIAGVLFLVIAIHDSLVLTSAAKSGFIIALEWIAGVAFLLNALLHWKKYK